MLVSQNPTLNILIPKENKALESALKEADTKTLQNMVQNKSSSPADILKDLFNQAKSGTKSNTNIENMLKNSSVFKNLGSFSNSTTTLLNQIDENSNLAKFKPMIESFLKNISNLDENSLKEQINKSGVFLESKIAQNSSNKLEQLLNQIQNITKDLNSPQAKQVNELITKTTINNEQNMKSLLSLLQNLSSSLSNKATLNLSNLTNQLSTIIDKASLLESKLQNSSTNQLQDNKTTISNQTKELLTQIKSEVLTNNPQNQTKNLLSQIDTLIKANDLFSKIENISVSSQNTATNNISTFTSNFASNLNTLLMSMKNDLINLSTNQNNNNAQNSLLKVIDKIEIILKENVLNPNMQTMSKNEATTLSSDMKSILLQMSDDLASKTDVKSQEMFRQVDKMITQIEYHQLLSHSGNSNSVYVPFLWDMLEDGSINMKKTEEEKFYCQINLTLKDFGKVDLMMAMYDKNKIDISIYAQRDHFKNAVKENLQSLKKALNDVDLIPVNIKLLDLKEENEKTNLDKQTEAFVNPYNNQNSSSVDIRV